VFEIVFFGTSASAPSVHRGLSSQLVMYNEYRFLIDCGEGTQRQILRSGVGFRRIDRVLLTHGHLDHILGLGGLLSTFSHWESLDRLEIWAGRHTLERVHDLIYRVVFPGARPRLDVSLHEVRPGTLLEDGDFRLSAFPVSHRGSDSYGFLFEEVARRPFLPEKAEALGVPRGPERRELVAGRAITLAGGRVIRPEDVLGDLIPGTRLVHVGDAGRTDDLLTVARGVDALVIEATYLEVEGELATQFGHLTAARAARLARDAGVRRLILTHVSRRYRESEVLEEARAIFPNTIVARDFDHMQITRKSDTEEASDAG
jgi:ribonuclease Z